MQLDALLDPSIQALLLDLDGTIYHEDHALPGALELITALEHRGVRYACLTNSGSSPQRVQQRLGSMSIHIDPSHIYTAGAAAVDYVLERFRHERRVFNLATRGTQQMLEGRAQFVNDANSPCEVVIAGDVNNSYAVPARQQIALHLLRAGAALVGICADRCYPSPRGIEIGGGAFCAMLAYAANITPAFAGKPQPIFFHELCRRLNVEAHHCILIGDNLESDIAGAKAVGMKTVLTLTGVARREDAQAASPASHPDLIVNTLRDLL